MSKDNLKQEKQRAMHDINTRFLCDCCGKEKHNKRKHLMYDKNWNIQEGLSMCEDCYREGLGVG